MNQNYNKVLRLLSLAFKKNNIPPPISHSIADSPRFITFKAIFSAENTVDKSFPKKVLGIEESLSVSAGVPVIISMTPSGEFLFDFQKPESQWSPVSMDSFDALQVGVSTGNSPVYINFTSPASPQFLFGGASGSGKSIGMTVAGIQILRQYSPDTVGLLIADPHNSIDAFDKSPHLLAKKCTSKTDIKFLFQYLESELKFRKELGENEVRRQNLQTILLIADELNADELIGTNGSNKENLKILTEILKEGRKFRIRTILGVQHPTEGNIPGLSVHLPDRYIGRTAPNVSTAHLLGESVSTSKLSGKGDFYHLSPSGLVRFVFALPTAKDLATMKGNNNAPHISKLVGGDVEDLDLDSYKAGRPESQIDFTILGKYLEIIRRGNDVSYRMAQEQLGVSQRQHPKYMEAVGEILLNLEIRNEG